MSNDKVDVAPTKKAIEMGDLLKAGVQFGHESKRWNPKMSKYIYGEKKGIHIIDISKTEAELNKAVDFLKNISATGKVLFIGTKKQSSEIIKNEAIRAGSYYVDVRWAGGILTNFKVVKKSLDSLNDLEKKFEEGVEDRTKFEVSRMKKEWQRLSRLYSGIKTLTEKPVACVIVDTNYEKSAVRECRKIGLPIVGIVDTNSDPDMIDYVIPANDDAISSIQFILSKLADAVLEGNKGNGIKHNLKDYAEVEIKITKTESVENEEVEKVEESSAESKTIIIQKEEPKKTKRSSKVKTQGILERVKVEKEAKSKKK